MSRSHRVHGLGWGLVFLAGVILVPSVRGAESGRDAADDPAYAKRPAWSSGENGGRGFKGWNLVDRGEVAGQRGFKIGDSRTINSDINAPGDVAFGMFAQGAGSSAEAYRTFAEPLDVGQSFSVDVAVNFRSGHKGFDLRAPAADKEKVIFTFNIGADDYVVHNAASGNGSLETPYDAKTSFTVRFTQTAKDSGSWTIVRKGGVQAEKSGRYEGRAAGVKFYVLETDGGRENDLWINNLLITAAGRE